MGCPESDLLRSLFSYLKEPCQSHGFRQLGNSLVFDQKPSIHTRPNSEFIRLPEIRQVSHSGISRDQLSFQILFPII